MNTSTSMPSDSFTDEVKGLVTSGVVLMASAVLGEPEAIVTKGLLTAVAAIFGALASKAGDRPLMGDLFDMVTDPATESSVHGMFIAQGGGGASNMADKGGLASRFMSALFENKTESVSSAISSFAGVTQSKGVSMLGFAGPLVVVHLGRIVRRDRLDTSGLSNLLLSHKNAILRLVPDGLSGVLGFGLKIPASHIQPSMPRFRNHPTFSGGQFS